MEVCIDNIASALEADRGGASRIELCSSLSEGGLTPSIGLLRMVKKQISLPVFCMIRPRGGDFLYSDEEIQIMESDIQACLANGADGLVFGCLTDHGTVDKVSCIKLLTIAKQIKPNCPLTFHRAIDMTSSILEAAQLVHTMGFDRILTSGGFSTALEGKDVIKQMRQLFIDKGPIIMPGSGVNKENLSTILTHTGATEFHGSASIKVKSQMKYTNPALTMGSSNSDEYSNKITSAELVKAMCNIYRNNVQ